MTKTISIITEPVTMFTVCVLIKGRDILLDVFRNEDIMKGVLISVTHMKPRSMHALNETTFLVTYSLGILAEDMGSAIEKINEWLGKPVVITCNEGTVTQLPQVLEHVYCTPGIESILFNTGIDDIRTKSIRGVCSGYQNYAGGPAVPGASGTTFLNKIPGIP